MQASWPLAQQSRRSLCLTIEGYRGAVYHRMAHTEIWLDSGASAAGMVLL